MLPKLLIIGLIAFLLLNLTAQPVQTQPATTNNCPNPGAQVWAQMSLLERAAYGLCAAGEVTK
jgi:hypothetical protein